MSDGQPAERGLVWECVWGGVFHVNATTQLAQQVVSHVHVGGSDGEHRVQVVYLEVHGRESVESGGLVSEVEGGLT